jgi:dephospho-CoA kinase|tara:strand:- start:59 stop:625 length:567 start_codon:yes stop_codon:yes gene_type:complete
MIKIGITGSIASGKTTASKIISNQRGKLFSADKIVKKLYTQIKFKKIISKKLKFKLNSKFKYYLKKKIYQKKENLTKLENIIHPLVRKEMLIFLDNNGNKKFLFFEIPLLIESNLIKYFDKIIFIKSNKKLRLKRYRLKGGSEKFFSLLDQRQMKDTKKIKFCDHIVVNNKSLSVLKDNLLNIMKNYE